MFLFEPMPVSTMLMWVVVLAALIVANELTRRSKWIALGTFLVLPIICTFFVWPKTSPPGTSTGTWFHWAKVYSTLVGSLGFMALRYIKPLQKNKYALLFPPVILAVNILEACIRDFQCAGFSGIVDQVNILGGPWNYMNGIAGLLNIITITGWLGIVISRDKSQDMIWPDQLWFWIIAYDLWNFAYVYNCVGDHAFYAGAALLISCTIPAFFIKKGAWLQHRSHTLSLWMMFTMAVPSFVHDSQWSVKASLNPNALMTVSALSLAANVAVFVYWAYRIRKYRLNPFKQDIYTDLRSYQNVVNDNNLQDTHGLKAKPQHA